ncbi:MAG TPA: ClbS/DfsB family four-helix bundle protein [Ktedonobacterales bacterium]|nr:ClbS/DfsB family four-helix bundle protein [Ktedonobacterales bacterium]
MAGEPVADEPMTKARFLETMRARRREWEDAIVAVGVERMTLPGFAGVWSVRDVVAHITAYERWTLEHMEAEERGDQAAPSLLDDKDMERRNLAAHEQTRHLSLDEVMAEARRIWEALVRAVERTPEEDLIEVVRAPGYVTRGWGRDTALWEAIEGQTFGHYEEHLPDFQAWAGEKGAASAS